MSEWRFGGLDGGNPLAFLAALGALRCASLALPDTRVSMRWERFEGAWRPILQSSEVLPVGILLPALHGQLQQMVGHRAFTFAKDLALDTATFRSVAMAAQALANARDRRFADFVAAFASESVVEGRGAKPTQIQDTALRTMSGAGHQHFVGFMAQLAEETTEAQLDEALFSAWRYSDPAPSLRWDPTDDRRYALRWKDPSGDPICTVRGANRLAIEALPLLPVAPVSNRLETTGFSQRRGEGVRWTWPIWEGPLVVDAVRSLLGLRELQDLQPSRARLWAMGVTEVYRSQRITQGKYRNFTPAVPA